MLSADPTALKGKATCKQVLFAFSNRIIELTPHGSLDKLMEYDEYISSSQISEMKSRLYEA
ncbi:hypothetical protein HMPREF9012_0845 [Bacteroidetes bacterium oral taxon 272 str. F0290]|nr:hypothetical protein HMPREF9012_0845 [Bacteroidetes bacterium oral taxon 272 str. F0290]